MRLAKARRNRPVTSASAALNPRVRYLTDGVNLYRVVDWGTGSMHTMLAELEDCRSLELLVVSAEDLIRAALAPVMVQPADQGSLPA